MKLIFISILLNLYSAGLIAQIKLGNNVQTINSAAILEMESTNKGFLIPRMSTAQRNAIANPPQALMIYNTDINCTEINMGTPAAPQWRCLQPEPAGTISSLDCAGASHAGNIFTGVAASGVSSAINYTGGNGGPHTAQTVPSTGVTGLTATLSASRFLTGNGTISYTITGTAAATGTASFVINIGGVSCTLSRQVISNPAATPGNTFTGFSNGTSGGNQVFSANSVCQSKLISAGHTSATCNGTITTSNATYSMVLINGQCWMRENLKEPSVSPCAATMNTGCNTWLNSNVGDIGAWGYYNTVNTNGAAGWATNEPATANGLLYQWKAAMNGSVTERAQGVCPSGWHVPSDCEWMYLEHGLGMSIAEQSSYTWRNTGTVGSKLSAFTSGGNNSSGFSALLAGARDYASGSFFGIGSVAYIWSSTEGTSLVVNARQMTNGFTSVYRGLFSKGGAHFVRCLKD